jgi:fatty acid desaturase
MEPLSHSHYRRRVKDELPPEAFAAAPRKLVRMVVLLLLVVAGYATIRACDSLWCRVLLSLAIGHTLACLAFLTHELAHGAIVRARLPRYLLECLFWGLLLIPATVWRRVHNHTHHAHASTPRDPDRAFLRAEESLATRCYTRIFYPHRRGPRWNPMVALHLAPYVARNVAAAFWPARRKPCVVPAVPEYSMRQRLAIVLEIAAIAGIQAAVFWGLGASWQAWFWASPAAYGVTSAVTMTYIFTNHFLNPISESADPLLGTTSLTVPAVFDRLHAHFSLHTEHHLFPSMNSDYYPLVAEALRQHFPDRYQRLGLIPAWQRLWQGEEFHETGTRDER